MDAFTVLNNALDFKVSKSKLKIEDLVLLNSGEIATLITARFYTLSIQQDTSVVTYACGINEESIMNEVKRLNGEIRYNGVIEFYGLGFIR